MNVHNIDFSKNTQIHHVSARRHRSTILPNGLPIIHKLIRGRDTAVQCPASRTISIRYKYA